MIGVESISGLLGLITGDSDVARYIQMHRLAGYGILAILGWKAFNITSSLGGRRKIGSRLTSLALAGTLFGVLTFGFAWFSGVSCHIYAGVLLAPLVIWHANHLTRLFSIKVLAEPRNFLKLSRHHLGQIRRMLGL